MSKHTSTTDDDRKYYEQSAREEMAAYLHNKVWAPIALLAGLLDTDNASTEKRTVNLEPLGNLIGLIANGIRVEIEIQANDNPYYCGAYRWIDAGGDMRIEWRKKDSTD